MHEPLPQAPPRFLRALLAFLALPGVVAYLVPVAAILGLRLSLRWPVGFLPVTLGSAALLWCVRDFHVAGHGTLAPWAPPGRLVDVGLYRISRNPMYVSVVLVLAGWALAFASPVLLFYMLVVAVAFHLRVVYGEEPWLAHTHGAHWQAYRARVRRWL